MHEKNKDIDRTVPPEENYYSNGYGSSRYTGDIIDNQQQKHTPSPSADAGFNPVDLYNGFAGRPPESENRMPSAGNNGSPHKKTQKKKAKPKAYQILLAVLLAAAVGIAALALPVLNKITYDDKKANEFVKESELTSSASVTNILLLGVDARADEESSTSRSDSMMLVSLDKSSHKIKLVSFLRDTWAYIPCADKNQRLNAACSLGGDQGVADTIEYNFGIKIDGYVVTDFEMFKVMVDSIGGVEVEVTEKEAKEVTGHQKRYDHVTLEEGRHTLTGEQALAYCRIRKIDTDWKRTERQRTVMQEILKGILHSGPITDYKMAVKVAPYIETNLSKMQIIKAGLRAIGCVSGGFDQTHLPFDDTWQYSKKGGASVITIDKDENKDKLIEYLYQ